jgi:hypothetical protein
LESSATPVMLQTYTPQRPGGQHMGFLDKIKDMANKNKDKVADGVDKATDVVDDKTGGKHSEHLDQVDDAAEKFAAKPDEA